MPRKLITFLGTISYKQCVYQLPSGDQSQVVHFAQEALAQLVCSQWAEPDEIVVFLTKDAEAKNWSALKERLRGCGLRCSVTAVMDFREGFSESEIWENFQTVFDQIGPNDKVWLDITNAFRSIPAFTIVLLNYARFLKNIQVEAIFYGAFEALGTAYNIEERIPDPKDRIAPILDIKNLIELQEWTQAAGDFLRHGNAKELAEKANKAHLPDLAQALQDLTMAFSLVRGTEIVNGTIFSKLKDELVKPIELAPLKPILEKVGSAVESYRKDDILNGFRAAQWCYDHQLYQQGITILRETIVSLICREAEFAENDYTKRKVVENAFNCFGRDRAVWKIEQTLVPLVEQLINQTRLAQFAVIYQDLSHQYRNDINHGGFHKGAKPAKSFITALNKHLKTIKTMHNF